MADQFIWKPDPETVNGTNAMRLARSLGLDSYEALYESSISDIDGFWDAVVADLDLKFDSSYDSVSDSSKGIAWTTWFNGGAFNLANNCVDRWRETERTALIWEQEDGRHGRVSYAELAADVSRCAHLLKELGVVKGDAVGIYLPFCPEAVTAFFSVLKVGAIAVPIFSGFGAPAVSVRLNDSRAKVLFCSDGFFRRGKVVDSKSVADEALADAGSVTHAVVVRKAGNETAWIEGRDLDWASALEGRPTDEPSTLTPSETPAMIGYTSGTTGKPKGAVHVHAGLGVKLAAEVAYQTDYRDGEVLWWFSDLGWIMGPWQLIGTMGLGGTVLLFDGAPDHPDPGRLWEVVERHRVNVLGVSPTLIRALMTKGDQHVTSRNLSSLRVLGSTGEPWNDEPYRWFFNTVGEGRCPIINISGGTEVGACFLGPNPGVPLKVSSLGVPSLGMAIDVWDPEGNSVVGEVGELVCTRPWPGMTRGIWGNPQRYLDTYWSRWPDVWVHGDWALIDEDGQWFLRGRSDDTLNIAGKRVGPAEIESAAVALPQIVEAAAIGVPHAVKGEVVQVWCVATPDVSDLDSLANDVTASVVNELGKAFRPASVQFVDSLPKTRSAKVLRRAVRAIVLGLDPGDMSSIENPDSLDQIRSRAAEISKA